MENLEYPKEKYILLSLFSLSDSMILFFGTRTGRRTSKRLEQISCTHCNQKGTLTVISRPNYIHLFWIPLLKIGTFQYAECSHCKKALYKDDFTPEIQKALGAN
ncbi:MAG: zinc-ribbon domain-containing protein [Bacteroidota bacterium]